MQISINLLPFEFTQAEHKRTKFYKVQALGVAVILMMVFLSSLSVALRILQSQNIKGVQSRVSAEEQKIEGLKDRQASLLLIKNRLAVIDQFLGNPSKQADMFLLLDKLIPATASINSTTINKNGEVSMLMLIPDTQILDNITDNLLDLENNKGQIRQISIESISRGRDGVYRISLKIKPSL